MANVFHAVWDSGSLRDIFDDVLDGNATEETLDVIRLTAEGIYYSADCAIGYEAASLY